MGNRPISNDLKAAALRLRAHGDSDKEIGRICGFSLSTLARLRRRVYLTGNISSSAPIRKGRRRRLIMADSSFLLKLARHNPTLFLDEYLRRLKRWRAMPSSLSTLHCSFIRAGLRVKQVQKLAAERDPIKRADFVRRIGQYPAQYLIFMDEVSKDERTYARLWGRAPAGVRVEKHNPFVRKRRLSMLAALALDQGIIASRVVEGSFTRSTFLEYLRDDLLLLTTPYPGPRSVLVLDNAKIHHSDDVVDMVKGYGCRIEYLPPYSPDYNPIELAFRRSNHTSAGSVSVSINVVRCTMKCIVHVM